MHTPIAFIIFNRPDTTEKVFAEIASAKPKKLFVIADGPRTDHPEDEKKCAATQAIIERVNWECEVHRNYSDVNLGCGRRPATGISWVFEHVDRAIIFEDDCLPHPTFFPFCEELLEKYHDDERVMMISGMKDPFSQKENLYSYSFRRTLNNWGWATWRRAWQYFDFEIKLWPKLRDTSWLLDITGNTKAVEFYTGRFDHAYKSKGNVDYWDYQWGFACWAQNGLSVVPNTNLIINIGFGEHATHTKSITHHQKFAGSSMGDMVFPLHHPPYVVRDYDADHLRLEVRFREQAVRPSWYRWLRRKLAAGLR